MKYTPMVTVGASHAANPADLLKKARDLSGGEPAVSLTMKAALKGGKITLTVSAKKLASDLPAEARVYAAIAEDHLVTSCPAGENKGRELKESGVVRALGDAKAVGDKLTWEFAADAGWKVGNLRAVAFVQDPATWITYDAVQSKVAK